MFVKVYYLQTERALLELLMEIFLLTSAKELTTTSKSTVAGPKTFLVKMK